MQSVTEHGSMADEVIAWIAEDGNGIGIVSHLNVESVN
jgi:hypothetical protein